MFYLLRHAIGFKVVHSTFYVIVPSGKKCLDAYAYGS